MNKLKFVNTAIYNDIRNIIVTARNNSVKSAGFQRMLMYWHIGERIYVEEQTDKARVNYGEYLIRDLTRELKNEFGSSFSARQLEHARKFYGTYPNINDVCPQLSWFHYWLLTDIDNSFERIYYEHEAINQSWTERELKLQINSQLFERFYDELKVEKYDAAEAEVKKKKILKRVSVALLAVLRYFGLVKNVPDKSPNTKPMDEFMVGGNGAWFNSVIIFLGDNNG